MDAIGLPAVHPGEILKQEYLAPLGMSAGQLAKALDLPRTRIERVVNEQAGISPDTAIRLAKFFRSTPQFWMNLQVCYDLAVARGQVDTSKIAEIKSA